jgi:hypothetical protein
VVGEEGVVERDRPECLEREPREQQRSRDPQGAARAKGPETGSRRHGHGARPILLPDETGMSASFRPIALHFRHGTDQIRL